MEKKYYITGDLEKTLVWGINNINYSTVSIAGGFRDRMINIIDESFGWKVTEFIEYNKIIDYFNNLRSEDEFIVSLEDWIYIENPDFNFSSTRNYRNKEAILDNPTDYKITQRDGMNINNQIEDLKNNIILSWKKEVIICDDWIFSWDTLSEIIFNLKKYWINVSEVRVILNFSRNNSIENILIKSMLSPDWCIDWLDERDLFYGTKNWWASFINKGKMNGLPYISSPEIASKKASIPEDKSEYFCKNMLVLNKDVWFELSNSLDKIIKLVDFPRLWYLEENYDENTNIVDVLINEQKMSK